MNSCSKGEIIDLIKRHARIILDPIEVDIPTLYKKIGMHWSELEYDNWIQVYWKSIGMRWNMVF
jgi:hypothetical protein